MTEASELSSVRIGNTVPALSTSVDGRDLISEDLASGSMVAIFKPWSPRVATPFSKFLCAAPGPKMRCLLRLRYRDKRYQESGPFFLYCDSIGEAYTCSNHAKD